jgi:hypothetical protein
MATGDECPDVQRLRQRNAIIDGRRSRTRDAIGAVRHVFRDAADGGSALLSRVEARGDLPGPSYVLHTSPDHAACDALMTSTGAVSVVAARQQELGAGLEGLRTGHDETEGTR